MKVSITVGILLYPDAVHKPWSQGGSVTKGFESPDNISPMRVYDNKRFEFNLNVHPSQPKNGGRELYHGEPLLPTMGEDGKLNYVTPPELQDLREYEPTPFEIDFMDRKEGGIGQFIEFDMHTEIYDAYSYVKTKSESFFGSFFGSTQAEPTPQVVEKQRTNDLNSRDFPPRQLQGHNLSPGPGALTKPPSYSDVPCEGGGVSPPPPPRRELHLHPEAPQAQPPKSSGGFLSFFGFGG